MHMHSSFEGQSHSKLRQKGGGCPPSSDFRIKTDPFERSNRISRSNSGQGRERKHLHSVHLHLERIFSSPSRGGVNVVLNIERRQIYPYMFADIMPQMDDAMIDFQKIVSKFIRLKQISFQKLDR